MRDPLNGAHVRTRHDQRENLRAALSWIREARDGHRGISARYIAWLWATFGQDYFLPLQGINEVCAHYRISPRTMRWNLGALRDGFGIGRDQRRTFLAAPERNESDAMHEDAETDSAHLAGRASSVSANPGVEENQP